MGVLHTVQAQKSHVKEERHTSLQSALLLSTFVLVFGKSDVITVSFCCEFLNWPCVQYTYSSGDAIILC